jgi:hypothetical protein
MTTQEKVKKWFPVPSEWNREAHKEMRHFGVPWEFVAPHEPQALKNHCGQTLERLAQRGGLSRCELVAVLEDRDWHPMKIEEAQARIDELFTQWNTRAE